MEDAIAIFTDLKITANGNVSLKRYFNSIKRSLPKEWLIFADYNYKDQDTFEIIKEIICIRTPFYKDVSLDVVFFGKLFLGLTENCILLLKTELSSDISKENSVSPIGYVVNNFHNEVLKKQKYYKFFTHDFQFGGPSDENWNKQDLRSQRVLSINSIKERRIFSLTKGTQAEFNGKKVFFSEPNNISLCLNIMKKSCKNAERIYAKLDLNRNQKKIEIKGDDLSHLYDYFEEIIAGLTFSFIAVESMTNAAIPEDYTYQITNDKGVNEIWPKESIERWMSTSNKLSEILPSVLKSSNIKDEKFWVKFKELENLRNEIVHQKTIEKGAKLDSRIFKQLINPNIFSIIRSSLDVIGFFYKIDNSHPYFPLGMGIARFKIIEIESMDLHFKPLKDW